MCIRDSGCPGLTFQGTYLFLQLREDIAYTDQVGLLIFQLLLCNGLAALKFNDTGSFIKKLPAFFRLAA